MHRGSSNGAAVAPPAPETLPLSASPSPAPLISIELELLRASAPTVRVVEIRCGAPVRAALRAAGWPAEGSCVLEGETPVPLDRPLLGPTRLRVVPTFSGG